MHHAQLALMAIAQGDATALAKALPAIDLSSNQIPLEDKLEFLAILSQAKHALDSFGIQQKTKALLSEMGQLEKATSDLSESEPDGRKEEAQ